MSLRGHIKTGLYQKKEGEKAGLEAQLLHSQTMQAIRTPTKGIAHDFNNILTAIIGYSSLLRAEMEQGSPLLSYVEKILAASDKAYNLAQKLLASSGKQIIKPKSVNLKETDVGESKKSAPDAKPFSSKDLLRKVR